MKIALITDAWAPQINGVVRTYENVVATLQSQKDEFLVIHPGLFKTIPCPTYREIRLALHPGRKVRKLIEDYKPDAIHIATEGPLGWAARNYCVRQKIPFTTSYHTRFPEYIQTRFKFGLSWSYNILRKFHAPSAGIMVTTQSLKKDLEDRGFAKCKIWTRGVDLKLFTAAKSAAEKKKLISDARPILMYVGRVAVEKGIENFLKADIPGTKYVVGNGPQLNHLKAKYPYVRFVGTKVGKELASYYRAADVFVFPSRTDTFGIVLIEALASGVPVAAYPVHGPIDIITSKKVGILNDNLEIAIEEALKLKAKDCVAFAQKYSWQNCAKLFRDNLEKIKR